MAANLTISQPGGAGAGVLNKDLVGARTGVALVLASAEASGNTHSLFYAPAGNAAAISDSTSQNAGFTAAVNGWYGFNLSHGSSNITIYVLVDRDAAGNLVNGGAFAPALGQKQATSADNRGVAGYLELAFTRLVTFILAIVTFARVQAALAAASASVAFNAQRLTGVADPVDDQDAATKAYADSVGGGGGSGDEITDSTGTLGFLGAAGALSSTGLTSVAFDTVGNAAYRGGNGFGLSVSVDTSFVDHDTLAGMTAPLLALGSSDLTWAFGGSHEEVPGVGGFGGWRWDANSGALRGRFYDPTAGALAMTASLGDTSSSLVFIGPLFIQHGNARINLYNDGENAELLASEYAGIGATRFFWTTATSGAELPGAGGCAGWQWDETGVDNQIRGRYWTTVDGTPRVTMFFGATAQSVAYAGPFTESVGSSTRTATASGTARTETYGGAVAISSTAVTFGGFTLAGSAAGGALTGGRLVAFTSLWAFDDHKRMVFSGSGSEACVVAIDYAGAHAQGAILSCFIPAGEAGSLVVGSDLNAADWDTFAPAADYLITACWTNGTVVSSGKNLGLRGVALPTLTSATVLSSDPDAMVFLFSEPVIAASVAGLSLTFNVGTPRTITSITSGLGTTSIVVALSGAVSLGDDIDLVIGSTRTVQDLNGNRVATGTHAVTLSGFALPGALPGATHMWRGDAMTTTGSDVDTVTDPIGGLTLTASTANPQTSTMGTNTVPCWEIAAVSYLSADTPSGEVMTTGFVAFTCDWTPLTADPACVIDGGRDGAEASWEIVSLQSGSSLTNYLDGVSVNISDAAFSSTGIQTVVYTWTPTERQIYVDGVLINTQTSALTVDNIGRWTIGMKGSLDNAWTAEGLKVYDVQVGTTHVDSGDAADYHAWAQGEVGF